MLLNFVRHVGLMDGDVVTLRNWTHYIEWYIPRLVVDIEHQKDT